MSEPHEEWWPPDIPPREETLALLAEWRRISDVPGFMEKNRPLPFAVVDNRHVFGDPPDTLGVSSEEFDRLLDVVERATRGDTWKRATRDWPRHDQVLRLVARWRYPDDATKRRALIERHRDSEPEVVPTSDESLARDPGPAFHISEKEAARLRTVRRVHWLQLLARRFLRGQRGGQSNPYYVRWEIDNAFNPKEVLTFTTTARRYIAGDSWLEAHYFLLKAERSRDKLKLFLAKEEAARWAIKFHDAESGHRAAAQHRAAKASRAKADRKLPAKLYAQNLYRELKEKHPTLSRIRIAQLIHAELVFARAIKRRARANGSLTPHERARAAIAQERHAALRALGRPNRLPDPKTILRAFGSDTSSF